MKKHEDDKKHKPPYRGSVFYQCEGFYEPF